MRSSTLKLKFLIAMTVCVAGLVTVGLSQTPAPDPPEKSVTKDKAPKDKEKNPPDLPGAIKVKVWPTPRLAGDGVTSEKSIAVDSRVNIQLCVTEGNVKINGWERNEVRVFVKDGSKIGFKVLQKNPKDDNPVWVTLTGYVPMKDKPGPVSDCIWGDEVEIDVPESASVSVKGRETRTSIDTLRKAWIKNVGGDISVRNVSEGVTALTYEGDVTVGNSEGTMALESSSGNIVAFQVGPNDIGDTFKAKTGSGAVSLQKLGFRQTEVNSISGSLMFSGEILSGGAYSFWTTNGSIKLSLPVTTSCHISASYGFGSFNSELPFKVQTENIGEGPVKTVVGLLGTGSGDATLKMTSNNGSINIKKQ